MYKNIMMTLDGSKISDSLLDEAIKLTKEQKANVWLIHVVDESFIHYGGPSFDFKLWRAFMKIKGIKRAFISTLLVSTLIATSSSFAHSEESIVDNQRNAVITPQIFEMAKRNEHWKQALVTGKDAQIVFMSITPKTNPNNEIGMETHKFDQVIFVVEGQAKSVLNGKNSTVTAGDMIFIPQGTPHNFMNLNTKKPFKIISVYSATDIPENAIYQHKSDMPQE